MSDSESLPELSIADVLRHYGAAKVPEGAGWRPMRCPFHGDAHASARVNVELGAFKCHGCPMSGDALKLISLSEGIKRGEAIGFARKTFGASVSYVSQPVHGKGKRRPLGREKWKEILG